MLIPMANGRTMIKTERINSRRPNAKSQFPIGISTFDKSRLNERSIKLRINTQPPIKNGKRMMLIAGLEHSKIPSNILMIMPMIFQGRVRNQLRELKAMTISTKLVIKMTTPKVIANNK